MDLPRQSSAKCHHVGGKDTHPRPAKRRTPHTSHYPSRPVENSFKKAAMIYRFEKNVCDKFFQRSSRSQFLEHNPHCRSEEPLRSVA